MKEVSQNQRELTIGSLAKSAGVNVETVRYYQRIGLLDEPQKPKQGFRKYPKTTIEQLKFIMRAQQLGFSLQEIADLLALGDGHCCDVRIRAEQKRDKIEKQIQDLQVMQKTLTKLIHACHSGKSNPKCSLVESLFAQSG